MTPWLLKQPRFYKRSIAGAYRVRCNPHRSTYINIRLAVRFFALLASKHTVSSTVEAFEQTPNRGFFNRTMQ